MEEIQYIGERLWAGQLGHFLILLSFVASIFTFISFYQSQQKSGTEESSSWLKLGRIGFIIQGLGILLVIGLMFYMMLNQFYEYQYVNSHVSADLPTRYIFSAFWEGQEGSFLLWMFWHVILGFIIIWKADKWEAPVLATLSMIQIFLLSMLVGVVFEFGDFSFKLGSSPFLLLRDVFDLPLFSKENYVELIGGQGMNILLQNYWMTIHPPTLFLGFASTAIPFGYAIGGLWSRDHKATMKAVLPWALFSGGILGTGILMGAAWAYEALSFGGYWAWDPVENASLVPWLILIAAIHSNLIARSTGYSIKSAYLFYILTFLFIVYSTFLTRSGILGDSSAHAFTEMGLEWQLIIFMVVTVVYSLVIYFKNSKSIIVPKKEESTFSKEFWMFIGSLVLIFSAILITFTTSIPVYNSIGNWLGIDAKLSSPPDVIEHYNKYQIWIGILVGILSGAAQYLRWKEFDFAKRFSSIGKQFFVSIAISAILTAIFASMLANKSIPNILLLFAGFYTVISNLDYLLFIIKGKMKIAGSALSHIGLGIFILGVISSGVNKGYVSSNPMQRGLMQNIDHEKNTLLIKGLPTIMNGYRVTFVKDTFNNFDRYYHLKFQQLKDSTGVIVDEFDSYPSIVYNKEFKMASTNPSTKRYVNKDIFNHLAAAPEAELDPERAREIEDSLDYVDHEMFFNRPITLVDTVLANDKSYPRFHQTFLRNIYRDGTHPDYHPEEGDIVFRADLDILKYNVDTFISAAPMIVLRENLLYNYPAQINPMGWKAKLSESFINEYFKTESELNYQDITIKDGQSIRFGEYTVTLAGFDRAPNHPSYSALPNDIALGAKLIIRDDQGGIVSELNPIYLVRNSQVFQIKDEDFSGGISARFGQIDPKSETFTISLATYNLAELSFPITIAQDAPRNDWIVLESIIFPGMNMVWIGSIAMMFGLFFSIWNRISTKRSEVELA